MLIVSAATRVVEAAVAAPPAARAPGPRPALTTLPRMHFVDARGLDAGARDGFLDDDRAEVGRLELLQPAEELAGGRFERH